MSAVVFVGPSLAPARPPCPAGVTWRPPAEAGDLYRAAKAGARVIGLIDGAFEDRPTVWHKEILWALAQGVRVYGAASLGALRAAECAAYGMQGVGEIYARCASGALEDDHELALAYAPGDLDFMPLSEPLVNVRATVAAARAAGVLAATDAAALVGRAEALPYREITWRVLAAELPEPGRTGFEAWLPGGRVDLKRADALALLEAVAAAVALPDAGPAGFGFEDTRYWRAAVDWFEKGAAGLPAADLAVLDELRLDPERYERALVRAYARRAAAGVAWPADLDAGELVEDLRIREGLGTAEAYRGWRVAMRAEAAAVDAALAAEERLMLALETDAAVLAPALLDALRVDGRFAALDRRAADKQARLGEVPEPVFRETEIPGLVAALCARRRVRIDSDDPEMVARSLGLADGRALHRLLAREEAYLAAGGEP